MKVIHKKTPQEFLSETAINLREQEGINQRLIAKEIGMNHASYNHMEAGRQGMKLDQIIKLRDFYNSRGMSITLDYLLTGEHAPSTIELNKTIAILRKENRELQEKLALEQDKTTKLTNTVVNLSAKLK